MLLDLRNLPVDRANGVVDLLCKSIEDGLADAPHPTDPFLGAMEDAATLPVRRALIGLYDALLGILVTGPKKTLSKAKKLLPSFTSCDKLERKMLMVQPGSLTFTDYLDVIDCLLLRHLPVEVLQQEVQVQAVRQYLVGHLRTQDIPHLVPALAVAALPKTVQEAQLVWKTIQPYDVAFIEVAKQNAARLVTDLTASARSRMKKIILDAEKRRLNDTSKVFNPQPLSQQLAEAFGDLNRDWRRVAVTETAINSADGFVATLPSGTFMRWVAHPGACDYCTSMNGRIFEVVPATHPHRNPETQMWVGKHLENVGRAIAKRKRLEDGSYIDRDPSERVIPAIPAHPNCRCVPVPHIESQRRAA